MNGPQTPTQIINVSELKRAKKGPKQPTQKEPIGKWLILGAIISGVFLLLALVNIQFLYLTPLGILLGLVSWGIKNLFNKLNLKENLK